MAQLNLQYYPKPILRQTCAPVEKIDDGIRKLAADMRDTMLRAKGIGLAAPQVGSKLRLFVADVSEDRDQPLAIINPRIIRSEGRAAYEEGCLSIPGVTASVPRAQAITVVGATPEGEEMTLDAEDLLAICIQHEIDHLDGVLFFDRLSLLKRTRLLAKYKKLRTEEGR